MKLENLVKKAEEIADWAKGQSDQEVPSDVASVKPHLTNIAVSAQGLAAEVLHLLHFTGRNRSAVDDPAPSATPEPDTSPAPAPTGEAE